MPALPGGAVQPQDDGNWFKEVVQPHEASLRGYLRKRYPAIDADDIVQESYLKLFRAKSASPIVSARAFLFAIATNTR